MVSNPKADLYQMFPIPLYVTTYDGDMTEISKYLREKGYVDGPPIIRVEFKDKFIQKNKKFYNNGVYWVNEVLSKDFDQQQDIDEQDLKIEYKLQALEIVEQYVTFSELDRPERVKEKA